MKKKTRVGIVKAISAGRACSCQKLRRSVSGIATAPAGRLRQQMGNIDVTCYCACNCRLLYVLCHSFKAHS